jgi:hypothetical protein
MHAKKGLYENCLLSTDYFQYVQKNAIVRYMKIQRNATYTVACSCALGLRSILHQFDIVNELKSSLRIILARHKVHHQRILDSEHRVVVKVLVLAVKDLGRQRTVVLFSSLENALARAPTISNNETYNNVNVSRAEGVAVHEF